MWQWLIVHTAVAAALAGLVLLAGRKVRLPPAALHLFWLVVLLKLLTPPVVAWPWRLPWTPGAVAAAVPSPTPVPATEEALPTSTVEEGPPPVAEAAAERLPSETVPATRATALRAGPADATPEPALPLDQWLGRAGAAIWAAGGALLALVQASRIGRWRRRLARGTGLPPELAALVAEAAAALGVRPPRAVVLPGLGSPMVWGFGPARLLWPAGLEDRLPPEGVRAVLTHELAHLRRRDHWVGWLLLAGGCVWWWHPLFAFVRRRLGREAERACDAWVVALRPGGRRAYAEALLEVSQRPAAAAPALGAAGGRRDLEGRLVMIMRGDGACRVSRRWRLAAGALALLAVPAWTLGQQPNGPANKADSPKGSETQKSPHRGDVNVWTFDYQAADPATAAKQATPAGGGERDKKLAELETKLQALLKEIQALRGEQPKPASGFFRSWEATHTPEVYTLNRENTVYAVGSFTPSTAAGDGTKEVTLSRKTYTLATGKAEAVANFLKENVKAGVLETRSDGEKLVVTTTPEVQAAVGQLVALVNGRVGQGALKDYRATTIYEPVPTSKQPPKP